MKFLVFGLCLLPLLVQANPATVISSILRGRAMLMTERERVIRETLSAPLAQRQSHLYSSELADYYLRTGLESSTLLARGSDASAYVLRWGRRGQVIIGSTGPGRNGRNSISFHPQVFRIQVSSASLPPGLPHASTPAFSDTLARVKRSLAALGEKNWVKNDTLEIEIGQMSERRLASVLRAVANTVEGFGPAF